MIGVVAATAAGRRAADRLAAVWPDEVERFEAATVPDALRAAFDTADAVVSFLATGATVRILAPRLGHKSTDPAVVCVDETCRYAVALLGAHHGANTLAHRVAAVLGAEPVVTTASDSAGITPLDSYGSDLGFVVENPRALPAVAAAVLSGAPVGLVGAEGWPLPPLPDNVAPGAGPPWIVVSDLAAPDPDPGPDHAGAAPAVLRYRPPSLVVGVGASRGVAAEEVLALVDRTLAEAGLSPRSVAHLASADAKADEPGLLTAARRRGWPVRFHPAVALREVETPHPSAVVAAAVGTPSVAEAAALVDGPADLVVTKRKSAMATVAVARLRPRGRLAIVGLGPGARDLVTPRAVAELRRSSVVVGLDQYVARLADLLAPGTRVEASGLGAEEARARRAVAEARAGRAVALVGSGDAGVYAMASPALEFLAAEPARGEGGCRAVDVVGVPGVTAALAASSLLGAPLGHDHAYISLSDLHTPWGAIERRVRAAADGDFVVCFYNPRSRQRDWQLPKALGILAAARPPGTPVGLVRHASRPDERVRITTLADLDGADLDGADVDMVTVVIVGASTTTVAGGRMVTPRGYRW